MRFLNSLLISMVLTITLLTTSTQAVTFEIQNNCAYTVWAAAVPGGGQRLTTGQKWILNGTATAGPSGRVWARTNCTFNTNGTGRCQTGDCGGLLTCKDNGAPPVTLVEYTLHGFNNLDFLDISLVDGFNVPLELSRPSDGCTGGIGCTADINDQCPPELRAPGGCYNPCTVFKTSGYCCTNGPKCEQTYLARFFKERCPTAYSYAFDDQTSTFTCPSGGNYRVVFCP